MIHHDKSIAITGHTQGLGKALQHQFLSNGYNVKGYSRTNGYDINDFNKIINDAIDTNIFINNAYDDYAQVSLLYSIFDKWKDQNKLIVNISSLMTEGIRSYVHPYTIHKAALDKTHDQLVATESKVKLLNIKPGWIDTPRVAKYNNINKINPYSLATLIYDLINNDLYLTEIKIMHEID